jgi:hypothetical protein
MRRCRECGELKPVSDYKPHATRLDRLQPRCKPCHVLHCNKLRRQDVAGSLIVGARSNAKRRGIPFTIDRDDIVVPDVCPVLGIPLRKAVKRMDDNSPSIDRIDSSLGYVQGNIRIISWKANRLKSNATLEDLEALVRYMRSELRAHQ